VELVSGSQAVVRVFADRNSINEATGAALGSHLTSPDNLAVDAWGNVYIVEDNNPGHIFQARDLDQDGVAETVALFLSNGVGGSEPSGLIFDPNDPYRAICCVQHPSSGNDALWSFDLRPYDGTNDSLDLLTTINGGELTTGPARYVKGARAFDQMIIHLNSPTGKFNFGPVIFFYDLFVTGFPASVPGSPFLHVDIPSTVVVL
ncbi:MAG: DUF839 domain-containing protein, partial [Planctomycetes bacterium]|nr:DUF839 domain-containing protein [Planctomycetota bacterium]